MIFFILSRQKNRQYTTVKKHKSILPHCTFNNWGKSERPGGSRLCDGSTNLFSAY